VFFVFFVVKCSLQEARPEVKTISSSTLGIPFQSEWNLVCIDWNLKRLYAFREKEREKSLKSIHKTESGT